MADRYWVGGTAAWDGTAGTKWATTSGGAGGASVPGGSDDVYFDAASGAAVVNIGAVNSRSLICTGFTGSFTGASQVAVYGGLTLSATMTHTNTLQYIFAATSGTWTVTTAGKTIGGNINFGNGASTATWTLQDNLTSSANLSVLNGTFNTNNFNVTATRLSSSNSNVRAINLGSSTITLSDGGNPVTLSTATNLTFNAGTSNIVCISGTSFEGGGLTFYNVSYTSTVTTTMSFVGTNTFNNLTFAAATSTTKIVNFQNNQTINGTLSVSGTTSTQRVQFSSNSTGTQRTISLATAGTLTNTNWKDIALTGAASPWTAPFGVGNLGNNSGITFNTQTAYWIGGTGNWTDSTKWSFSSGGSAVSGGVPQSTNSVVFDANSDAGAIFTVTAPAGNVYCNDFTANNLDFTMTYTGSSTTLNVFGSLFFPATNFSYNIDGASGTVFSATTTGKTVNTNGLGIGNSAFNGVGGGWTMQSIFATNIFSHSAGAIDFASYGISVTANFISSGTLTRSINLNTSTINTWGVSLSGSNLTFTCGTSTINLPGGSTAFAGNGNTFYNVNFSGAADYNITGANIFNNLTFTSAANRENRYTFASNQTINGTLTTTSTSAIKRIALMSSVQGTQRTLTAAAVSLTDTDFSYIVGAGTATWSGTRIGDLAGNSGITFTAPKTVYLISTATEWYSCTWANTSGGATSANNYPLSQDTMIIDNATTTGSGTANSFYMTGIGQFGYTAPGINLSARTTPYSTTGGGILYKGNVVLNSVMTGTGSYSFYGDGTQTITTNGASLNGQLYYNGYGGTLQLQDNLTIVGAGIRQDRGTLNLNSKIVTTDSFSWPVAAANVAFGTATVNLTGTGTVWSTGVAPTITGTSNIIIGTQSGAATFAGGGLTYSKLTLGNGTNSTAQVTITGSNRFGEISSNLFGGTLLLTAGTSQQVDRFTYAGYKDTPYNIAGGFLSSTSTTPANLTTPPTEYYGNFNGSSQYLQTPSSANLNMGTSNFTIEAWVNYAVGGLAAANIFSMRGNTDGITFRLSSANSTTSPIQFFYGAGIGATSSTLTIAANTWNHVALTRNGTSVQLWVNGVNSGTLTTSAGFNVTDSGAVPTIGLYLTSSEFFSGRMSNLRVVKGTALYTANFTPPTGTLTAVSGTQLLTLQSATIVDNSTNAFTITNTGSVTITQTTPFTRPFDTNYLKVSYVNVTPSNTWNALNSLSVIGTNTNWIFSGYQGNYGYVDAGNPIENKYVTKDYVMDYYPDLLPNFVTPQLFTWGLNSSGQLGDGTTSNRLSPVTTVTGGTNWKQVTANGYGHMAAIKTDGTLWTWGYNSFGILGDGTTTNRSSPGTTAGGGTNWKQVSSGFYHSAAIKTDGTLWTWGYNFTGRLGDGTTTNRSSPGTTAGGGTNWKQVTCAYYNTAAIKTDGTLWTWGHNNFGQLGDGTAAGRNSPGTVAGGGTNWKQVAGGYMHITAIKTDGTLWTWGNNSNGALGDGTTTSRSSPGTTASGGTNWKQIAGGNAYTSAIKTDGTLWMWGGNSSGQLGDGTTTNRSSPGTTAGSGTNWKQVSCGNSYTAAIKTDGTLWTWGINTQGQLGDGTTTSRRSPVTVAGGGTNWKQVSGYDFTAAISESEGW